MKKIIFYIDSMQKGGGANRVMANLTATFADDGYETILITDVGPKSGILEYEISDIVKRYCLDDDITETASSNFGRIKAIRKIVNTENPDVVLSFMGPPNIRLLLATIGLNVKKIISVRSDPNIEYGTGIKKFFKTKILSLSDGFVFQTDDAAKYFSKKIQKRSKVILNPVKNEFFDIQRNDTTKNLVAVGRLDYQKNHELLIRAFAEIYNEFPEDDLVIYGEGPYREKLEKLIIELGLTDRVFLPGGTDEIGNKLSNAKIFAHSSDFEGMPNALMEAMTVGVPAVSTDCPCGGPKTIITNSMEGRLVPCGDVEALANALKELLSNKELREKMTVCEKEKAKSFNIKVVYQEWKKYLEE